MWNNKIRVFIVFAALVTLNKAQRNNEYLPPSNAYLPAPDDPVNIGDANSDSSVFLKPDIQDDSKTQVVVDNHDHGHGHDHDHDHHHEHWDLRESIPGEPGQDYPLHYSVPETGFSCTGRTAGYYADIEAGCQAFHVCPEDAALATQSFLCPNGSIFNQEVFACDWWNNVDCAGSETHYVRNNEIGVYNPSNSNKVPVRLKPENRRPQEQEVDINFQPQSSNEDSRQYLPPVADNRKPIVTEYNGPPPTRAPVTIARTQPTRPATQRVQPTVARTQATTTYRPVTTERNYLPPVVEQEIYRPVVQQQVQRVTQRPVQRVPQPIPSTTRLPVNIENNYIPPAPTPSRNVVQQTFIQQTSQRIQPVTTPRPVTQQAYSRPSSQQFIQSTARPYQAPVAVTTSRPFQPIRVAEPAGNKFNFEGYNYDKPSVDLQTPVLESRPVSNQNYLPPQTVNIVSTQRPIPTYTTTPRPVTVSQTFAPIRQTPAPQNQRPSFSQTEGYNYPRPAVGLPAPSSTRAPVQQTRAPVRPTPAPFSQTQAPFRQTFAPVVQTQAPFRQTPAPQNQRPSFSQTEGYNYPKPSVGLPAPGSTRAPVTQAPFRQTFAPVTQTQAPIRQTYAPVTQAPIRQTFAPVTQTQAPIRQTFTAIQQTSAPQNQRPSFSQNEGYNYPRPAVGLPDPGSTRAPVTQAPIRQTFAPVQQTQAPIRKTFAPVSQTFAPVRQTFAPVTQTFAPVRQTPVQQSQRPSFSQTEGYNYPKPAVGLPALSNTRAPVQQTFAPVPQTQAPIRQTFAPVIQTFAPVRQTPAPQNQRPSFSQNEGYNYPKPAVGLPAPSSTDAPVRQTFSQVTQTATPVRQTFAPIIQTTQRPVVSTTRQPAIPTQAFDKDEGYSYRKPALAFELPSSINKAVSTNTQQSSYQQSFQLSSQQVGNAQATFNSENGYSNTKVATSQTNKPAGFNRATVSVQTISTTLRPQITKDDHSIAVQQNYQVLSVKNQNIQQGSQQNNQGYQYNLPAAAKAQPAPFSVKNSQTASYVAPSPQPNFAPAVQYQQDITSQQHTTCIHAQNAQSASLSSGVSQEYLPPVGSQSDISQISQQINNDFEGYNYPKPKTPFITPNNPTLKVSSSSFQSSPQGNQFGQASYQRQNSRNLGAESFIQGFNAASGNFHNNQQGVLNTQQSYQQHNSDQGSQSFSGARATSTSDSAQHHFDIVPSISFSYQLDPEAKNAKASHMSY